jgi:hypothetical protein
VITVNTKHNRRGRLVVNGDSLIVNGRATNYIARSRAEAATTTQLLRTALEKSGDLELARRRVVRPVIAAVGGLLQVMDWPDGATIVTTMSVIHALRMLPGRFDAREVDAVYELAWRSTTWTHA